MIATVQDLERQLAFTSPAMTSEDQLLMFDKLAAAQGHVERLLGYRIEDTYGGDEQDPVPPALIEAVLQLAAHWFDHREAVVENARELPFGVREIVDGYRDWTF